MSEKKTEHIYPRILKSDAQETLLSEVGYVVIKNFFPKNIVEQLLSYYHQTQTPINVNHIYNSVWHSKNSDYRAKTIRLIKEVYTPFCNNFFCDYKILGGSFVIKPGNGRGTSEPHRDFGTVDEVKFRAFSLWVPLVKLTKNNGPLLALAGSNHLKKNYKGPNIPDRTIYAREWIWNHSEQFIVEPGDCVVYDHRTIHGSHENFTTEDRIAISCAITNSNADLTIYLLNEVKNKIYTYPISPEEFLSRDPNDIMKSITPTRELEYLPEQITIEELETL